MTEQDLIIQEVKEENQKLKKELEKCKKLNKRIIEKIKDACFHTSIGDFTELVVLKNRAIEIIQEEGVT